MPSADFTADAWILGERWRHHRQRDHFGVDSDLYVALSEPIGPWDEFTPVHFVIEDLMARLVALETSTHVLGSFTCNAYFAAPGTWIESPAGTWTSIARLDAVIGSLATTDSFTADAFFNMADDFTADAYLVGKFSADAVLV